MLSVLLKSEGRFIHFIASKKWNSSAIKTSCFEIRSVMFVAFPATPPLPTVWRTWGRQCRHDVESFNAVLAVCEVRCRLTIGPSAVDPWGSEVINGEVNVKLQFQKLATRNLDLFP